MLLRGLGRREFVALALASAACGRWRDGSLASLSPGARAVTEGIRARLRSLRIPAETLIAWASDRERHEGPFEAPDSDVPHEVVSQFLMSTDFFPNGMDERRPLAYVTYYDPYVTPCYNPLRLS
jgi:hypothetical protein